MVFVSKTRHRQWFCRDSGQTLILPSAIQRLTPHWLCPTTAVHGASLVMTHSKAGSFQLATVAGSHCDTGASNEQQQLAFGHPRIWKACEHAVLPDKQHTVAPPPARHQSSPQKAAACTHMPFQALCGCSRVHGTRTGWPVSARTVACIVGCQLAPCTAHQHSY